ncbi:hypothetical protein GCM10009733_053320 [Nonomuraea maheshkhaliensis]|uniref:HTH asnC-type domain-containing protein n=1 Tax=Nonomuraea maheshkhaliensis TaxID=419590 RepID=A0ABP4RH62_9ACTN
MAHTSTVRVQAYLPPDPVQPSGGPVELDEGDRTLLHALNRDGRASYAELTAVTGRSESTVKRRPSTLRRAGILRLRLDLAPAAIGFSVEARLWINAQPARVVQIAEAMAQQPEVSFAAPTTGSTNLLVALACRSTTDLGRFPTGRIASLEGINAMETAPILRTVKRAGALLL